MASKMFIELIFRSLWTVVCVFCLNITSGDETVTQRVLEGSDVTISTGLTGIKNDAHIQWFYGSDKADKRILNSYVHKGERFTETSERFKDHLQLNRMSGALTIRNISTDHTGLYTLQIITSEEITFRNYNIRVYANVSTPNITNGVSTRSTSQSGRCFPVCTVKNGDDVTLSWYKENEIIINSTISSNETPRDPIHLPLKIQPSENQIYQCVAANPVSNRTTSRNITELCNISDQIGSSDNSHIKIPAVISATLFSVAVVGICIWIKHKKQVAECSKHTKSSEELNYAEVNIKDQNEKRFREEEETKETVFEEEQCVYAQVKKTTSLN